MRIGHIELHRSARELVLSCPVTIGARTETLWYAFDPGLKNSLFLDRLDAAVVGLLPTAMQCGEPIEVDGALSEKLWVNLTTRAVPLLAGTVPGWRPVPITPRQLDDRRPAPLPRAVGAGFSGGVDSFAAIARHRAPEIPPAYRVTHLLFNNVGAHDRGDIARTRELFLSRHALVKGFPEETGLSFIRVDSNLHEIARMDFFHAHPLRNASAALNLQKLFGKFYYASAYRFEDCFPGPTMDIATLDPALVPLLSTESLEFIPTGHADSRVEKTRLTAEIPQSRRFLNVCVTPRPDGRNCSQCEKCARTLLTLELLGLVEEFHPVFDLPRYRRVRTAFLAAVLVRRRVDPYAREIVAFARRTAYPLPCLARVLAAACRFFPGRIKRNPYKALLFLTGAKRGTNP